MRDISFIMAVFVSISFSEWVVERSGLSFAGGENRTGLGSDGEVILTSERLSSGGLSLSIIHSKDGSFMVESVKIDQNRTKSVAVIKETVDGQTVCT